MTSSEDLIDRASRGDDEAIEALFEKVMPDLQRYVRVRLGPLVAANESASDIVQSTCRELVENMDQFEYRGWKPFRRWLFQAAIRKLVERKRYYRADRRNVFRNQERDSSIEEPARGTPTPSHEAMAHETQQRLFDAIDQLDERDRELYGAFFVLGLSNAEVASEQDAPLERVRKQRSRLIAKMGYLMERSSDDPGES